MVDGTVLTSDYPSHMMSVVLVMFAPWEVKQAILLMKMAMTFAHQAISALGGQQYQFHALQGRFETLVVVKVPLIAINVQQDFTVVIMPY